MNTVIEQKVTLKGKHHIIASPSKGSLVTVQCLAREEEPETKMLVYFFRLAMDKPYLTYYDIICSEGDGKIPVEINPGDIVNAVVGDIVVGNTGQPGIFLEPTSLVVTQHAPPTTPLKLVCTVVGPPSDDGQIIYVFEAKDPYFNSTYFIFLAWGTELRRRLKVGDVIHAVIKDVKVGKNDLLGFFLDPASVVYGDKCSNLEVIHE